MDMELTIDLFATYFAHEERSNPNFNKNIAIEVSNRLEQLKWILGRITELNGTRLPPGVFLRREDAAFDEAFSKLNEMKILTESFYYFAFRARSLIRKLAGLKSFECIGVRNVRNQLIEHPERKDSGVVFPSFGWGGENGPVIKSARYDYQIGIYPDAGLYVNATEFKNNLEKILTKRLARSG